MQAKDSATNNLWRANLELATAAIAKWEDIAEEQQLTLRRYARVTGRQTTVAFGFFRDFANDADVIASAVQEAQELPASWSPEARAAFVFERRYEAAFRKLVLEFPHQKDLWIQYLHDLKGAEQRVQLLGMENPWLSRAGWEGEPEIPIVEKKIRRGDGTEEAVPVERGYILHNRLVKERHFRPFRTSSGEPRVAVPTEHGLEIHDPAGDAFLDSVGYSLFTRVGEELPDKQLRVAAKALECRALARDLPESRIVELWLRVAPAGEFRTRVDLLDRERRCVVLSPDGWAIETIGHPVFDPRRHMRPLPEPQRAEAAEGDWSRVNDLWRFVGIAASVDARGDDPRLLALTSLVQFLVAPASPKTVTVITGDEGVGKSSAASRLQAVIEPSLTPLVKPPEDDDDLNNLATNHAVINIDNVSFIDHELSDNLARLSTGISLPKRRLFTDADEVLVSAHPWILVNGITATPRAADLLRRSVFLNVAAPTVVVPREQLSAEWDRLHPSILGGLFDLAVRVLAILRDAPPPLESSSMADYVRIGQAVARATGGAAEDFLSAWRVNLERQTNAAAEDPWVSVLGDYFGTIQPTTAPVRAETVARWINENCKDALPKGQATGQLVGNHIARAKKTLARMGIRIGRRAIHGRTVYFRIANDDGPTPRVDDFGDAPDVGKTPAPNAPVDRNDEAVR